MADKRFDEALAQRIDQITGSDVFTTLYHPGMADFRKDPWPAIELAIAILLDKPIVVAVLPGRKLPAKLAAIADRVIEGDVQQLAAGIVDYLHQQNGA